MPASGTAEPGRPPQHPQPPRGGNSIIPDTRQQPAAITEKTPSCLHIR
jgi:hypothetical protein